MTGSDSLEERTSKIDKFTEKPEIKIFLITLGTGAIGLNLQAANKVIFMDPWWNPQIEEQAIGRCYRYGQNDKVEVVKFVTQNSIEARIKKLGFLKKELSDSILDIDNLEKRNNLLSKRKEIDFLLKEDNDDDVELEVSSFDEEDESEEAPENGIDS